ncbi:hypothetical protein ACIQUB_07105 [Rhizobium sp. NPDC090275]|uniref:hypothetical protein n=1 Tax=Rhizobium sp. NPDC090275 TaxID=3364498 RepID=UPI00383B2CF4
MKLPITKEWLEKRAALENGHEISAGKPDYVPGFVPSAADRHYSMLIEIYDARIAELQATIDRLRSDRGYVIGCIDGFEIAIEQAAAIAGEYAGKHSAIAAKIRALDTASSHGEPPAPVERDGDR